MLHRFVTMGVLIAVAGLLWVFMRELSPWLVLPVLWLASVPPTIGVFACAKLPASTPGSIRRTTVAADHGPACPKPVPEGHNRMKEAQLTKEREPSGARL